MSGTKEGGHKAAARNKEWYGDDFYRRIGAEGGKAGDARNKGFASNKRGADGLTGRERAAVAGRIGGMASRRPSRHEVKVQPQTNYVSLFGQFKKTFRKES